MEAIEIPLVTLAPWQEVWEWLNSGGLWPLTKQGKAKKLEEACGLNPCRYYFAGLLHPRFGEIAFVFQSGYDHGRVGFATPFDSGGLFYGHMAPLQGMSADKISEKACQIIQSSQRPLEAWRDGFVQYVEDFFEKDLSRYLGYEVPTGEGREWLDDLPVKQGENRKNKNWRSWGWEVRLEESLPILSGTNLLWVACLEQTYRNMGKLLAELEEKQYGGEEVPQMAVLNQLRIFCREFADWADGIRDGKELVEKVRDRLLERLAGGER